MSTISLLNKQFFFKRLVDLQLMDPCATAVYEKLNIIVQKESLHIAAYHWNLKGNLNQLQILGFYFVTIF